MPKFSTAEKGKNVASSTDLEQMCGWSQADVEIFLADDGDLEPSKPIEDAPLIVERGPVDGPPIVERGPVLPFIRERAHVLWREMQEEANKNKGHAVAGIIIKERPLYHTRGTKP